MAKQKPEHVIRLGRIKAAIWRNDVQTGGVRHNVTITRLYKPDEDDREWKESTSFGRDDLPLVAKVADQAHTWIFEETQRQQEEQRDAA